MTLSAWMMPEPCFCSLKATWTSTYSRGPLLCQCTAVKAPACLMLPQVSTESCRVGLKGYDRCIACTCSATLESMQSCVLQVLGLWP